MFSQSSAINNCLEKHFFIQKLKHRKLMSDKTYRKGVLTIILILKSNLKRLFEVVGKHIYINGDFYQIVVPAHCLKG